MLSLLIPRSLVLASNGATLVHAWCRDSCEVSSYLIISGCKGWKRTADVDGKYWCVQEGGWKKAAWWGKDEIQEREFFVVGEGLVNLLLLSAARGSRLLPPKGNGA